MILSIQICPGGKRKITQIYRLVGRPILIPIVNDTEDQMKKVHDMTQ